MSKVFIDACFKKEVPYTPVWMMRQAGRSLPEYRKLREKLSDLSFLDLIKNPEIVAEVTLQPVKALDVDAAILFSDILNIAMEMGLPLEFTKSGPIFKKVITTKEDIDNLDENAYEKSTYVYEGIKLIKEQIPSDKALIGFCGSPWTIATYMVEGKGSKFYTKIKKMAYVEPNLLHQLMEFNTTQLTKYLFKQIEAGVEAVMIFDSWGGGLERDKFIEFSWDYMKKIAKSIKEKYPHIAVIGFSKGVGLYMDRMDGEFDVIGIDWNTPMEYALNIFKDRYTLQGNMDPARMYSKEAIKEGVEHIVNVMKGHHHIFNLGHGIFPDTPFENIKYFVNLVKEKTKR